ncbi:hypothetical protein SUGI_0707650 [Cryptomeria japonica]|nr:hypothetical protein SUGI_0707650 [Cryptomeria japonica]
MEGLFPNLTEELGLECLMKVSYQWHSHLRAVNKQWREAVNSNRFYQERKRYGIWEQIIWLIQDNRRVFLYYPLKNSWEILPPVPILSGFCGCCSKCICVNHKLIIIEGSVARTKMKIHPVFHYDFRSSKWSRGADMPTARAHFACSASPEGLIYIAGGMDNDEKSEFGAAVYDVDQNKWELLPDMNQSGGFTGAFLDDKFWVMKGNLQEVFDVNTRTWALQESASQYMNDGKFVAAFGKIYSFMGREVWEYDTKQNSEKPVDLLPSEVSIVWCVTLWRDKIFVCASDVNGRACFYLYSPPRAEATTARKEGERSTRIEGHPQFNGRFYRTGTVQVRD